MDVVMIPLVWPGEGVESALDVLRRRERAGLVVNNDPVHGYRLLHAGDMLRARQAGVPVVGEVTGGYPVLVVEPTLAESFHLDLVRPTLTWSQYEEVLDKHGTQFALVGESDDTAMVVTRHEEQTETLRGTGGYQCNGVSPHYFPEPRVSLGDRCPEYPLCSSPDGEPVIRQA
jgi:hypothetical protein